MTAATVLCIEDVSELREAIAEELEDVGYQTLQAGDGRQGLEVILAEKPDLVISDVTMPNMSGLELVAELRNNHPLFDDMPFIFLSALAEREDVLQGLRKGADDYLTKPVDFDMLLQKVDTMLQRTQRTKARMAKKQAKLAQAKLQSGGQSGARAGTAPGDGAAPSPENPKEPGPPKVVLVGKQSKALTEIGSTMEALGMSVTSLTSGREFVRRAAGIGATLSLIWLETDDHRAPAVMNALEDRKGKFILVAPMAVKEVLLKPVLSQFDDVLAVPVTKPVFLQSLKKWLGSKPEAKANKGASAFI